MTNSYKKDKSNGPRPISNGVNLAQKKCVPCEGGTSPFARHEAEILLKQVHAWTISADAKKLSKSFKFKNFKEALGFANAVGAIAEKEGHHPDLSVSWGKTTVALTTHAIKGLSKNDFIMAAKIDKLERSAWYVERSNNFKSQITNSKSQTIPNFPKYRNSKRLGY